MSSSAGSSASSSPAGPEPALAARSGPAWVRFLLPAVVGTILDLWSKAYAFPEGVLGGPGHSPGRQPSVVPDVLIPHVLGFQTTVNHGAVFGTAQGWGGVFIVFSFAALAAIVWVFARSRPRQWVLHVALGLITAGAVGNLYDRIQFGCVRDFLKLLFLKVGDKDYYPYIFNVADVLLCIGVPLLMLYWMFVPEEKGRRGEGGG